MASLANLYVLARHPRGHRPGGDSGAHRPDERLGVAKIRRVSGAAIKNRRGKLEIPQADVEKTLVDLDIRILPYTRELAMRLFGLPWHHPDPFHRQILAQALEEEIPIITSDEVFGRYAGIRVIW
jgi:hypothetical protein